MSGDGLEDLWLSDDRGDKAYLEGRLSGYELKIYLLHKLKTQLYAIPNENISTNAKVIKATQILAQLRAIQCK